MYTYIYIYLYKCGAPGTSQGPESGSPWGVIYNIEGPRTALGSDVPFQVLRCGYLGPKRCPKCVQNEAHKAVAFHIFSASPLLRFF